MRLAFLLSLLGVLAGALNADTIFDSTGGVSGGVDCIDNTVAYACGEFVDSFNDPVNSDLYASFTTEGAGQITDVQLVLTGENTSSGAVQVGLYADNSTAPGALITSLGTISDSLLSGTPSIYDLALTVSPEVAAATRYWIGLSGTTTAGWSWTNDFSGTSVSSEFSSNFYGTFSDIDGPYQMSIATSTTNIVAPEPASALLLAAGVLFVYLTSTPSTKDPSSEGVS